jgi:hypothetical protein
MLTNEELNELTSNNIRFCSNGDGTYRVVGCGENYPRMTVEEIRSALHCLALEDRFDPYYL